MARFPTKVPIPSAKVLRWLLTLFRVQQVVYSLIALGAFYALPTEALIRDAVSATATELLSRGVSDIFSKIKEGPFSRHFRRDLSEINDTSNKTPYGLSNLPSNETSFFIGNTNLNTTESFSNVFNISQAVPDTDSANSGNFHSSNLLNLGKNALKNVAPVIRVFSSLDKRGKFNFVRKTLNGITSLFRKSVSLDLNQKEEKLLDRLKKKAAEAGADIARNVISFDLNEDEVVLLSQIKEKVEKADTSLSSDPLPFRLSKEEELNLIKKKVDSLEHGVMFTIASTLLIAVVSSIFILLDICIQPSTADYALPSHVYFVFCNMFTTCIDGVLSYLTLGSFILGKVCSSFCFMAFSAYFADFVVMCVKYEWRTKEQVDQQMRKLKLPQILKGKNQQQPPQQLEQQPPQQFVQQPPQQFVQQPPQQFVQQPPQQLEQQPPQQFVQQPPQQLEQQPPQQVYVATD